MDWEHSDSEIVWLKDVTTGLQTDKRSFSDSNLPDTLTFELNRRSRAISLNLKRNHGIDPNADVYYVTNSKDGQSHLEKAQHLETEDLAYYQDINNGAFMTVKCVRRSNGQCDRVINGNILIEDRHYDLQPAKTDITSRDLLNVPDQSPLYVLRAQGNVQSEKLFARKDSITAIKSNVEEEVESLLGRLTYEQRDHTFPNSKLFTKKGETLHNRDNQKQVYTVEIAVMLDSGIWDFYSSLMQSSLPSVTPDDVARFLRLFYSQVINGVSLPYKAIKDPGIEIRVTLREFYILQRKEDFKHSASVVKTENGRKIIHVFKYLQDFAFWTSNNSAISDHVILFTRYFMYNDDGYAYFWEVCDKFLKTSVIRSRDYFMTAATAAHELGHNLGSDHDGEGNAIACRAEDQFIMTPKNPVFTKSTRHSRNPWIFSNCSVDVFKYSLKNKTCLNNVGDFYDLNEWTQFTSELPGEVFSIQEQCQFAHGYGSTFCGLHTPSYKQLHTPSYKQLHTPSYKQLHTPNYKQLHTPSYKQLHTPSYKQLHTPSYKHLHRPSYKQLHTPNYKQLKIPSYKQLNTPSYKQLHTPSYQQLHTPSYKQLHTPNYKQLHTPSYNGSTHLLHTPSYKQLHTPSYKQLHTPSYKQLHTPNYKQLHTPSYKQLHTPSYKQLHTPSYKHLHRPSYKQLHTPNYKQLKIPSYKQLNTPSYKQLHTPSYQQLHTPSYKQLHTPNYKQLHTPSYNGSTHLVTNSSTHLVTNSSTHLVTNSYTHLVTNSSTHITTNSFTYLVTTAPHT
ncbi:hypothetical protein ACJMK2_038204 [Sinanodonta woodiana]|uniref:Peptidase M12B domain-containing protein n=1 Tax=Sinanodonta woodiana TaxID=1069815 RepID=A0ABD3WMS5_SINWO